MTTSTKELIAELMQAHKGHADEGVSTFSEAAQRLRELDKPDCFWTHDGFGSSNTACGEFFSNIMPSGAKFCTNCGGAVRGVTQVELERLAGIEPTFTG